MVHEARHRAAQGYLQEGRQRAGGRAGRPPRGLVQARGKDMNSPEREETKLALLRATLEVAVPMWIEKLKLSPIEFVLARANEVGAIVAGPAGADVLYRSRRPGDTASAFNALAEGVACLS